MPAQKKLREADAIFARLAEINPAADRAEDVPRLSLGAKATVKAGPYSRGGEGRAPRKAADHDFRPKQKMTPHGIFLPRYDELSPYLTTSRVTSGLMAGVLGNWWLGSKDRFGAVRAPVINQDDGPGNKSRRTQFLKRIVGFARESRLLVRLAHYPPHHGKYNPIEHCWGVLENHWNGDVLDEVETVLASARTMTWDGKHPKVELLTTAYPKGARLPKKEMLEVEKEVERLPDLADWLVDIPGGVIHLRG